MSAATLSSTRPKRPTALAAGIAAVLVLTACNVDVDFGDDDAVTTTELESFVATDLAALDISNVNGAITVRSGSSDKVEIVTITRESRVGDGKHTIEIDGDRLIATGDCKTSLGRRCSIDFNVSLPANLELVVTNRNGQVQIDSLMAPVSVSTRNGSVEGLAIGAGVVEIDSGNGSIDLDLTGVPTSVNLSTSNGSISVSVPVSDTSYDVNASTGRGSISIDVPRSDEATAKIAATTSNGAIEVSQG